MRNTDLLKTGRKSSAAHRANFPFNRPQKDAWLTEISLEDQNTRIISERIRETELRERLANETNR